MNHPYGFIPLPIPVGAMMPYHYGAILQPVYDPRAPCMHCDSAGINKAAIKPTSGQSSYHENRVIPSQLMNTNSRRKNNSCIIQDKFIENEENQLTW
jgi:pseudo-response regulator 5